MPSILPSFVSGYHCAAFQIWQGFFSCVLQNLSISRHKVLSKFHFKNECLRNKDIWALRCTSHFWNAMCCLPRLCLFWDIQISIAPQDVSQLWSASGHVVLWYHSLFPFQLCPCINHLSMESKCLCRLGVCRVVKNSLGQYQPSITYPASYET